MEEFQAPSESSYCTSSLLSCSSPLSLITNLPPHARGWIDDPMSTRSLTHDSREPLAWTDGLFSSSPAHRNRNDGWSYIKGLQDTISRCPRVLPRLLDIVGSDWAAVLALL